MASIMTATWDAADINAVYPGKKVVYCYDAQGVMVKRNGILEQAKYTYTQYQRVGTKRLFSCHADLVIRLAPAPRRVI